MPLNSLSGIEHVMHFRLLLVLRGRTSGYMRGIVDVVGCMVSCKISAVFVGGFEWYV
jgi:hypothetical protein